MATDTVLSKLLSSFERYYTITTDSASEPFDAEATFHSHGEQYVLVRAAKVADIDSNDYAFFKSEDTLTSENLDRYMHAAWETGMQRVKPYNGHRNSDVTLIILADSVDQAIIRDIKKAKLYKSYKFSLWGWSNFRLIVKDLSSGAVYHNRFGADLKKVLANINE